MEEGIYYKIFNKELEQQLEGLDNFKKFQESIKTDQSPKVLARYFSDLLEQILENVKSGNDKVQSQIDLVNKLIKDLEFEDKKILLENWRLTKNQVLKGIFNSQNPYSNKKNINDIFPYSGITESDLFTGNNAGISLDSEIKKEILSSDEMCFLVSFIKWSGLRLILDDINQFVKRGGNLRVISTSYMGATDSKAIHELSKIKNVAVKVSYNSNLERLHAKAYLFKRKSGFDTGFIGSSNMSRSALTKGLEWNVKITTREAPQLLKKFESTFESYWEDNEFEIYKPDKHKGKLVSALKRAKTADLKLTINKFFDLRPYNYQKEILDKLHTSRTIHNKWQNLLVAATGTGKTIVSAFDYKRFKENNKNSKLLYIAHRREILEQAQNTFCHVLRDNNFGELWVGNHEASEFDHVFVSVQKLNNKILNWNIKPDHFDFIIIDEVHHIKAKSYRPILEKFTPKILLGLTATPERMDGQNILLDFGGDIDAEIRLPDALNRKILCPFHYFGVSDSIDLSKVSWSNGRYKISDLSGLYTENDRRVGDIIKSVSKYTNDPFSVKALGFCVSIEHAKYMSDKFNKANLKSDYLVSGEGTPVDRLDKRNKLMKGDISYLFVVDVFNEGVDLPAIDTVLFLRPTESLTIFLQQLGRGLRLSENKECLTVLDFVGNAREEYNFAQKYRALIGRTENKVKDEIESGFPHLPLGCSIILEKKAREHILKNVSKSTSVNINNLVSKIRNWPNVTNLELTLRNFTKFYSIPLEYIYKKGRGWEHLKSLAQNESFLGSTAINETFVNTVSQRWLSCNSISYFKFIKSLATTSFEVQQKLNPKNKRMALMLYYDFWKKQKQHKDLFSAITKINECPTTRNEMIELMSILISKIDYSEKSMIGTVLRLHSRYNRDQILAALGASTFEKKKESREGSFYLKEINTELLFVTLDKSEGGYSPTTSYEDYALSETIFHWQSQNSKSPDTPGGRAYINHKNDGREILLFVREKNKNEHGNTLGFVFLGKVNYISHKGSKPMSIMWKLDVAIPSFLIKESEKMKVG